MTTVDAAAGPVSHIREHISIINGDLAIIRRATGAESRLLDVGAGPATFVQHARRVGLKAWALDIERSSADVWRARGIPGMLADGFRLPFRDNTFQVVRIKEVVEHVDDPRRLLEAAHRVIEPSGLIIAHVPSPYSLLYPVANFWDDYTHVRPLTRRGLGRLFQDANFDAIRIEGYVAGRNALERLVGGLLGRVIPHTYRVVARRSA